MSNSCLNSSAHEWVVYSTALQECYLLVQCVRCGMAGIVADPTRKEWSNAYRAPSRPYRWADNTRVEAKGVAPFCVVPMQAGLACDCIKSRRVLAPAVYERMPGGIAELDRSLTTQERFELVELATLVGESGDLCSHFFPLFIHSVQLDTGITHSAAVRLITKRIDDWNNEGMHLSPGVVAKVLRDFASN